MHRKETSTPIRPAGETRTEPPWILRQTLVAGAILVVLHVLGAFAAADRWVVGTWTELRPDPPRQAAPLLLGIDGASVLRWGAPPWSLETWGEVAAALGEAGIEEAFLVDPWVDLVRFPGAAGPNDGAVIRVPRLLQQSPGALPASLDPPRAPPLVPWDHQLHLPPDADGVIRGLTGESAAGGLFGPSAFCAWTGACPEGDLPIRVPRSLPTLSLVDVATGERLPDALELERRTILLGVTDPWLARRVHVGPGATLATWPEAVGYAIATARSAAAVPSPGPLVDALLLVIALLGSLVFLRFERLVGPTAAVLAAPLVAAVYAVSVLAAGWLVPPFTAMVLAAAAPPLVAGFTSRRVAREFLRHVALLLVQDGFRYAWKDSRLHRPDEIADKLAVLLRSYLPDHAGAYLHRDGRRLVFIDGVGLEEPELQPALTLASFRLAAHDPDGARCDEVFTGAWRGRALPIREGRSLVGFWIVAWRETGFEPDAATLAHLARWTGLRLALHDQGLRARLLDRLETDAAQVQRLFTTASEERRRQVQALNAVEVPLLTSDLAGSVQFVNRAMTDVLDRAKLASVQTVGELFRGLSAEAETDAALRRLFVAGVPLETRWRDPDGHAWAFHAQPVYRGAEDHHEAVLGYVVHASDLTSAEQLEEIRASVVDFASTRVRNALMVIVGYAGLLRKKAGQSPDEKMLATILRNAEDVGAAMDELKALGDLQADADREVEVDVGQIVREQVREARPIGAARGLDFTVEGPDVFLPVLAAPGRARDALGLLLREGCVSAGSGTVVRVRLEERPSDTRLEIAWDGPGLDPTVQAEMKPVRWHLDPTRLSRALLSFARARDVFPDLEVISAPGQGMSVRLSLKRAGRT